jgi:hypothetical protein
MDISSGELFIQRRGRRVIGGSVGQELVAGVLVDPGPKQEVQSVDEFLAELAS